MLKFELKFALIDGVTLDYLTFLNIVLSIASQNLGNALYWSKVTYDTRYILLNIFYDIKLPSNHKIDYESKKILKTFETALRHFLRIPNALKHINNVVYSFTS